MPKRALVVIDVQNEYFDGALPISDPPLFSSESVPVASPRISTAYPRWAAWRDVVSTHMWVM